MTQSFFSRFWHTKRALRQYALPDGLRVYAVGDIHGRFDCLAKLEDRIADYEASALPSRESMVIFLGDYVDRGPSSREVLQRLALGKFAGLPARYLLGNHEDAMLGFLETPDAYADWLSYGGMATLASYGVRPPARLDANGLSRIRCDLLHAVPPEHIGFLRTLELSMQLGDYLFVHAGVRPGLPLDQQRRTDLLTIREPFLSSKTPLPWRVVHGHTVLPEPIVEEFRISLDTGAYATGRLSCAVIVGNGALLLP